MVFDVYRKPIGLIFETFGPVKRPFYSIRFNTNEEIVEFGLKIGCQINFAEGFSEFVKIEPLLLQKGSDASWTDDKEVDAYHMVRVYTPYAFLTVLFEISVKKRHRVCTLVFA